MEDVERYFAASDIFVSPSYREGFGLVVVEAEAMGLPAIVTDVPGQIDAIVPNKTGLTCKAKDAKSLEKAMRKLRASHGLRSVMGMAGYEFVKKNYEQKKLFEKLEERREKLADRGNG